MACNGYLFTNQSVNVDHIKKKRDSNTMYCTEIWYYNINTAVIQQIVTLRFPALYRQSFDVKNHQHTLVVSEVIDINSFYRPPK